MPAVVAKGLIPVRGVTHRCCCASFNYCENTGTNRDKINRGELKSVTPAGRWTVRWHEGKTSVTAGVAERQMGDGWIRWRGKERNRVIERGVWEREKGEGEGWREKEGWGRGRGGESGTGWNNERERKRVQYTSRWKKQATTGHQKKYVNAHRTSREGDFVNRNMMYNILHLIGRNLMRHHLSGASF